MDNTDSMKPQQTGGLKLMTVFIAVLALHVLVIGGFTVYHLMSGSGSDADLALDKTHKLKADGTEVADAAATATDAAAADKSTGTTTASTDNASSTGTTTAAVPASPAADATATTTGTTPAPVSATSANPSLTSTPVSTLTSTPPKPTPPSPLVITRDDLAQSTAPGLAPPPDSSTASGVVIGAPAAASPAAASASSGATGPVHMPAAVPTPEPAAPIAPSSQLASAPANESAPHQPASHEIAKHDMATHESKKELYTVKITDSYKKIAHAHHITVAQLKEANHIKGDVLHAGQKLVIPAEKTSIAKGEKSHDSIAPSGPILSETASTTSLSASPVSSPSSHHHFYTVAKGDTLKKIAKKLNTTTLALKEANNLSDGTKLTVGEKLKIPSKESRSADTTVPSPARPSQVETQPAPIAPPEQPAPITPPAPSSTPASSPELANLTF